jgi:transcriptional regulator with XRE-family HTH domain
MAAWVATVSRHGRRLPLGPVRARSGSITQRELATAAGVALRTVSRWWARGSVPAWAADELAVAVGEHPALLWPEWLALDSFDLERPFSQPVRGP